MRRGLCKAHGELEGVPVNDVTEAQWLAWGYDRNGRKPKAAP